MDGENGNANSNPTDPAEGKPSEELAPTPSKFSVKIGDEERVFTQDEAVAEIQKAMGLTTEHAGLQEKAQQLDGLRDLVRNMLNADDPEAFRRVAIDVAGWTEERANMAVQAAKARMDARRGTQPDDDDDDDDDDRQPNGGNRQPQRGNEPISFNQFDKQTQNAFTTLANGLGVIHERFIRQDVKEGLLGDKLLGNVFRNGGSAASELLKVAMAEAKSQAKLHGVENPNVIKQAIAKARHTASSYGLLDDRSPPATVGSIPGMTGSGFDVPTKQPGPPNMADDDYGAQMLNEALWFAANGTQSS